MRVNGITYDDKKNDIYMREGEKKSYFNMSTTGEFISVAHSIE